MRYLRFGRGMVAILSIAAVILVVKGVVPLPTREDVSSFSAWAQTQTESAKAWAASWGLPQLGAVISFLAGAIGGLVINYIRGGNLRKQVASLLAKEAGKDVVPGRLSKEDALAKAERDLKSERAVQEVETDLAYLADARPEALKAWHTAAKGVGKCQEQFDYAVVVLAKRKVDLERTVSDFLELHQKFEAEEKEIREKKALLAELQK